MNSLENLEAKLNNKFNEINNSQADIDEKDRDYRDLNEMIDLEIEQLGKIERNRFYYPSISIPEYLVYDAKEKKILALNVNDKKDGYVVTLFDVDHLLEIEKSDYLPV